MSCWLMPAWMRRYRALINSQGNLVEQCMNDPRSGDRNILAVSVKEQVALLIRLRDAGELTRAQPGRLF